MGISLKAILCLATAAVSFLSVMGNKGGPVNITSERHTQTKKSHTPGLPKTTQSGLTNVKHDVRKDQDYVPDAPDYPDYPNNAPDDPNNVSSDVNYTLDAPDNHSNAHYDLSNATNGPGWPIGFAVYLGLLVVTAVIALILYRQKLFRTPACWVAEGSSKQRIEAGYNKEGNTGEPHYEEINVQNQKESSLPPVYANVSPPADLVHCTTVDFQKGGNTVADSNKNGFSAKEQGSTNPPAAEPNLYSTVTKQGEQ